VPSGIDSDEASIGYNAYALARTGRDEYGELLPAAFRAYGEYKRPAYIYAAAPFVGALGLTPFTVRLPAALAGVAAVGALYAVGTLLLGDRRLGLVAAGLLAVSPWHLQFTRAAREASLLVLAILVLVWALLAACRPHPAFPRVRPSALRAFTRPLRSGEGTAPAARRAQRPGRWLLVATLAFLLALYSYPGALLLAPLVVLVVVRAYWPALRPLPARSLALAGVVVAIGLVPLAVQFVDGRARARLEQASLLNEPGVAALSAQRVARDRADGAPWVLQAPVLVAARRAVDNYLAHFGPGYLFTRGDPEWRHHAGDTGQLLLWDLPLLVAGLVTLVRQRHQPAMQALGGWLLVAPLPAAFAERAPHAVRSIGLLPALSLLAALGVPPLWGWLRARGFGRDWLALLGLSVVFYLYAYYRYYPVEHARDWGSGLLQGYREAHALVDGQRYTRIVIPQEMGLSYAYALFATQYDPARYQAQGGSRANPLSPFYPAPGPMRFEPFEVRQVDWRAEPRDPRVLYVLEGPAQPPPGTQVIHVTRGADGQPALQLVRFAG
jgi:4-amino-4-deoxy-L-arabinose transferase-like glycosyltransferase